MQVYEKRPSGLSVRDLRSYAARAPRHAAFAAMRLVVGLALVACIVLPLGFLWFLLGLVSLPAHADVDARALLRTHASGLPAVFRVPGSDRVPITIEFPSAAAVPPGLTALAPGLAAWFGSPAQLGALADAHPDWRFHWSPPRRPLIDVASETTRAVEFRQVTGFSGQGAVVGLVDTGFDPKHGDLRDARVHRVRIGCTSRRSGHAPNDEVTLLHSGVTTRGGWAVVAAQPVAGDEHAVRGQDAVEVLEEGLLVLDVDDRVLGEDGIEAAVGEGQRAGADEDVVDPVGEALLGGAAPAELDVGRLDVDAGDVRRAEFPDQLDVDAAGAAADVEDVAAGEVDAFEGARHLLGTAG